MSPTNLVNCRKGFAISAIYLSVSCSILFVIDHHISSGTLASPVFDSLLYVRQSLDRGLPDT